MPNGGSSIAPKVDPNILEREYITTNKSFRDLGERFGMSWSAIATRARKPDAGGLTWKDKRDAFRQSVSTRSFDRTAEKFAVEDSAIREELVLVHRATIHAYAQQLREGKVAVSPKDAVGATQALLLMLGDATSRTESKNIDISANLPIEDLRQLAEFARTKLIEGTVADVTERQLEGTFQN